MQNCFRSVLAAIPAAAGLAFAGSAVAQQPFGELTRKEWRAHIERAQSRFEQLRQDGKIIEGSEHLSQQPAANREAREEWLARVDAARKRVEQLRASRETSEHDEFALKDDELAPSQAAGDDIRVGSLPAANNMVRSSPSEPAKLSHSNGKPSSRGDPAKQASLGPEQKAQSRPSKQVQSAQRPALAGGASHDRSPARLVQVSSANVAAGPSCTSFWGCLKQAVGIR